VYIIDGFNLVHKVPALKKSGSPHTDLIQYIRRNKFTGSRNNKVIIVFDGGIDWEAKKEKEYQIVFSADRSADDIIKSRISAAKNKAQIVVVSDDREIRDHAKRERVTLLRIHEFIKKNSKAEKREENKDISYSLQREITEEMRKIWDL
jgi:predicted RNA-binding protein with PIN domain